eukprot:8678280-Pyramimonas_sp.AAC.1
MSSFTACVCRLGHPVSMRVPLASAAGRSSAITSRNANVRCLLRAKSVVRVGRSKRMRCYASEEDSKINDTLSALEKMGFVDKKTERQKQEEAKSKEAKEAFAKSTSDSLSKTLGLDDKKDKMEEDQKDEVRQTLNA